VSDIIITSVSLHDAAVYFRATPHKEHLAILYGVYIAIQGNIAKLIQRTICLVCYNYREHRLL
jgi:hypothetical protein